MNPASINSNRLNLTTSKLVNGYIDVLCQRKLPFSINLRLHSESWSDQTARCALPKFERHMSHREGKKSTKVVVHRPLAIGTNSVAGKRIRPAQGDIS